MLRRAVVFLIAAAIFTGLMPIAGNAESGGLAGRIIILDAGHGDGGNTYSGYSEGTTMLILANRIKALLEEHGATVYLTRDGAAATELPARAAMINKLALETVKATRLDALAAETGNNPEIYEIDRLISVMQSIIDDPETGGALYMNFPYDYTRNRTIHPDLQAIFELENDPVIRDRFLMISLHSNATPTPVNTSVNGADVFYCSNTYPHNASYYQNYTYCELESYFGDLILDKIDALGIRKRTVSENNWFITREHNVPGVLVEHGFHTNAGDRAKLSDDAFLNSLAAAYIDVIGNYFDNIAPCEQEPPVSEVSPWYYDALNFAAENNLLPNDGDSSFTPDDEIEASSFAAMLTKLAGLTQSGDTGELTAWQPPEGFFENPADAVTREDAAQIIFDYLKTKQLDRPSETFSFSDDASINDTAREAVTAMLAYGVMVGCKDGYFYPDKTITHAEAAQVCLNLAAGLSLA